MHDRNKQAASHPPVWLAWAIGLTLAAIMGAGFGFLMTGGF